LKEALFINSIQKGASRMSASSAMNMAGDLFSGFHPIFMQQCV
jgi:hypothetical protein